MAEITYLYLMLSRTDTGIGRIIRAATHYPYNHVSLSLDPSMRRWVSFARYARDIPFYAGFVEEPVERYLASGLPIGVRIFRLEIPEETAGKLSALFARAGRRDRQLIYNLFDAAAAAFGGSIRIPNAYTCLSFACRVMGVKFRSIRELDAYLSPYLIYEGLLTGLVADSGRRDDAYFRELGLLRGSWNTARNLTLLSGRAFRRSCPDLVAGYLNI